jgi:hypothetical protein
MQVKKTQYIIKMNLLAFINGYDLLRSLDCRPMAMIFGE